MSPRSKFVVLLSLAMAFGAANAFADAKSACSYSLASLPQGPARGPISTPRDPEMEKQSYHNLEVAKYYFYKRKPDKNNKEGWDRLNKAVEGRLMEILDTNPTFARADEVFFMLGEVYKRMGDMDKAVENWTQAAKGSSDEKIKSEAQKRLEESKSQGKDQKKG
jgi:tetratricopeptide (TPR) repeat protein